VPKISKQVAKAQDYADLFGGNGNNIWSQIVPVGQLVEEGIKICIYGKSGTGKTRLWSTFPKPALGIICSGAQETRSINKTPGIDVVRINDQAQLEFLVQKQRETGKYKTVALDHGTAYQDLAFKFIVKKDAPVQMAWGSASQQQWGEIGLLMKTRLNDLLSLPCDVVIVAQEREYNTEQGISDLIKPYVSTAFSPSVTGWVGPAVDYLVQTYIRLGTEIVKKQVGDKVTTKEVETIQYCMRTGPHPVFATKFRNPQGSDHLPECVVNPDFAKIRKLIETGKL
jgi:hypothetical protein